MIFGIFLTFAASFLGSMGFVSVKRGLEVVDYKIFIFISLLAGLLLSIPLVWLVGSGLSNLSFNAVFPFLITGGLGGGLLARIATTVAAHEIGVSRAHAIGSAAPLITAFVSVIVLDEIVTVQLALGTLAIVVGACFLIPH